MKVLPQRGITQFERGRKLSPQFIGLFDIIERIGEVAYRLVLPPQLAGVHVVFHISMLKKVITDPYHIIELRPLRFDKDLTYAEHPIKIVDTQVRKLRNRELRFLKIQWSRHPETKATWELESEMRDFFPYILDLSLGTKLLLSCM